MQFINKEDDLALCLLDLVQDSFESLLKLAAVLCARNERAHVEREDGLLLQPVRHVAAHDTLCKPFNHGSFADAGFADQHRVVLALARQDADDAADLGITTDDRVEFLLSCALHKVGAVLGQHIVGVLGVVAGDRRGLDLCQFIGEALLGDAVLCAELLHGSAALGKQTEHQMLHRNVLILQLRRDLLGKAQHGGDFARRVKLAVAARHLRQAVDGDVQFAQHCTDKIGVTVFLSDAIEQRADKPALLRKQRIEQMLGRDGLILFITRKVLRVVNGFNGFLREFFSVHKRFNSFCGMTFVFFYSRMERRARSAAYISDRVCASAPPTQAFSMRSTRLT